MALLSQSLSRYILENTTERIFERGVAYAREGRVRDLQVSNKKLSAIVTGSQPYEVQFKEGPKYMKGSCTCPYALNEDYCKHVVALAIFWDSQRNIALPSEGEREKLCLRVEDGFSKKLDALYRDPLHADLQVLAEAADMGSWVRPHAKIRIYSPLAEIAHPVSLDEVRVAFQGIKRIARRSLYDSYFCAGEISALLSLAYDIILKRITYVSKEEYLAILAECAVFYYTSYLEMIDGSDGVWQIPFARIQVMFGERAQWRVTKDEEEKLRFSLGKKITGWGDIFEELQTQY
ncbi:MAG: SWIM zinc finger family protein [bacterium]|nr:SWIM zinc finger family protein [bacterium]